MRQSTAPPENLPPQKKAYTGTVPPAKNERQRATPAPLRWHHKATAATPPCRQPPGAGPPQGCSGRPAQRRYGSMRPGHCGKACIAHRRMWKRKTIAYAAFLHTAQKRAGGYSGRGEKERDIRAKAAYIPVCCDFGNFARLFLRDWLQVPDFIRVFTDAVVRGETTGAGNVDQRTAVPFLAVLTVFNGPAIFKEVGIKIR